MPACQAYAVIFSESPGAAVAVHLNHLKASPDDETFLTGYPGLVCKRIGLHRKIIYLLA